MSKYKKELLPELRFPEFEKEAPWADRLLSSVLKEHRLKSSGKEEVFSVSVHKGLINQVEHLGRSFSAANTDNYNRVLTGDVVYTKSPTGDFPLGIIKQNRIQFPVIVSPLYGVFTPETMGLGTILDAYFESPANTKLYLEPLVQKGAKNTINVNNKKFLSGSLPLPISKCEQEKLGSFLDSVDKLISLHTQKLEALKGYKKGLMQQLFPAEGETVPKLRFPEFKAFPAWEKNSFNSVFTRIKDKNKENNKNVLTISAQMGLVSQLDYFNKSVSSKDVTNYYLLKKGDFAYNKSYSQGYPMGAIKPLKFYDKGVVSTLYICFRANKGYDISFLEYYFDSGMHNSEIAQYAQEGARNHGLLNIGVNDFFDGTFVTLPKIEEQNRIAELLSSIDGLIDSNEEKLATVKSHKKALMQKLFPVMDDED